MRTPCGASHGGGTSEPTTSVTARVGIGPSPAGGYQLAVDLHLSMSGVDEAMTRQLAEEGHELCPFSRATRGNIDVRVFVNSEPDVP
jgi:lipoyl-dependent peroxiredoxin